MKIDEAFYLRLENWRRVYGDKSSRMVSPTYIFCRYAKAYFKRANETDEEKYWRELNEIKARDPIQPAPDYADAERLNEAWKALPDTIDGMPVKRCVKVFVFGSLREYEHFCRKQKVRPSEESEWRIKFLKNFLREIEKKSPPKRGP